MVGDHPHPFSASWLEGLCYNLSTEPKVILMRIKKDAVLHNFCSIIYV